MKLKFTENIKFCPHCGVEALDRDWYRQAAPMPGGGGEKGVRQIAAGSDFAFQNRRDGTPWKIFTGENAGSVILSRSMQSASANASPRSTSRAGCPNELRKEACDNRLRRFYS